LGTDPASGRACTGDRRSTDGGASVADSATDGDRTVCIADGSAIALGTAICQRLAERSTECGTRPDHHTLSKPMKGGEVMTDRDDFAVRELPARLALTLIDTSQFLNGSMLGADATQTAPIDQGTTTGSTTSDPTIANVMSSVDAARQAAAASPSGATAQNIDSPGATSYATTP
jgi:hypothetical protein